MLYYLAFECPLKGGQATFWARSLLSAVTDTVYNDSLLCATDTVGGERMLVIHNNSSADSTSNDSAKQKQPLTATMFPNPAYDYVILQLNQAVSIPFVVKVTDDMGQVIFGTKTLFTNAAYSINTSAFSSGVYYVDLYNDSGKVFGGKLTIFRK